MDLNLPQKVWAPTPLYYLVDFGFGLGKMKFKTVENAIENYKKLRQRFDDEHTGCDLLDRGFVCLVNVDGIGTRLGMDTYYFPVWEWTEGGGRHVYDRELAKLKWEAMYRVAHNLLHHRPKTRQDADTFFTFSFHMLDEAVALNSKPTTYHVLDDDIRWLIKTLGGEDQIRWIKKQISCDKT